MLAGCGSPSRPNASAPAPTKAILVANGCNGTITAYPLGSNGNVAPIIQNPGLCAPIAIAVDRNDGDLYAVNSDNAITVYAKRSNGSVAPKRSLAQTDVSSIGLDGTGRLYARTTDSILVYAPGAEGNAQPIATITGSNTGLATYGPLAVDKDGNVCTVSNGSVAIFSTGSVGNVAPSLVLPALPSGTTLGALAFDNNGNLYVAYSGQSGLPLGTTIPPTIAIYSKAFNSYGQSVYELTATIVNPNTTSFVKLAVDGSGRIYAFDLFTVFVYAPGSNGDATPIAKITGPFTPQEIVGSYTSIPIQSIAVDNDGQLFVTDIGAGWLYTFAPGSNGLSTPTTTIGATSTINSPVGMGVDRAGDIYVAGQPTLTSILAVPLYGVISRFSAASLGSTEPIAVFGDGKPEFFSSFALDSSGNSYVIPSDFSELVLEFGAGSNGIPTVPIASITRTNSGLSNTAYAQGIATDASNNVYISWWDNWHGVGGILKFAAGSNGDATPLANITGPATGFLAPGPLATDAAENLYVCDGNAIRIFPPGADGNVAPKAVITGSNTRLSSVYSIALDRAGNIYALNAVPFFDFFGNGLQPQQIIFEFAAGSNGNVAPIAVISGPSTLLSGPSAIAISE